MLDRSHTLVDADGRYDAEIRSRIGTGKATFEQMSDTDKDEFEH